MDGRGEGQMAISLRNTGRIRSITAHGRSVDSLLIVAMLAHVDLEFFRGAAAFPPVVPVAQAVGGFAAGEGEAAARGELDVEESKERAAELREGKRLMCREK